jgi:tryptophan 2,3-dioxygenase
MIDDAKLADVADEIAARYSEINIRYLERIGSKLQEVGTLSPHELVQLRAVLETSPDIEQTIQELQRLTNRTVDDLAGVFDSIEDSALGDARRLQEALHNPSGFQSDRLHQIARATHEVTGGSLSNISKTTNLSALYQESIDEAILKALDGSVDYQKAKRDVIIKASAEGMKVTYESGHQRRLDSAVRQNVLDGMRDANRQMQAYVGAQFGADGVEISAHMMSAKDHEPYQGKQYTKAEFETLQEELYRPFGLWNCHHYIFEILIGISEPTHTTEELDGWAARNKEGIVFEERHMTLYKATQLQREIETEVRRQRDKQVTAYAAGDTELARQAQSKITKLKDCYEELTKLGPLEDHSDRMTRHRTPNLHL